MLIDIMTPLITTPVTRGMEAPWLNDYSDKVKLVEDFKIAIDDIVFVVPKHYITDGASVPRFAWWLFPPNHTEAREASCIHDYFYSHLYWYYSKGFADSVFKEVMGVKGASKFNRNLFYYFVKFFGKGGWSHRHKLWIDTHWRTMHENTTYPIGD